MNEPRTSEKQLYGQQRRTPKRPSVQLGRTTLPWVEGPAEAGHHVGEAGHYVKPLYRLGLARYNRKDSGDRTDVSKSM
jgi:hypothetical protein